jgi:putative membrane protein
MRKASTLFTADDRKRIEAAVAEAESKTSAEIVPVVATASGRYDRPEDMVGVWLATVAVLAVWALVPEESAEHGSWGGWPAAVKAVALAAAVLGGFLAGAAGGIHVGWLRRIFTPRGHMRDEVQARARQAFYDCRVRRTAGGTGALIYVSLYERMAVVLADQAALEKLGQPALDELCKGLTGRLKGGDPTEALVATIRAAGERLSAALPQAPGNVNELPNGLMTID